MKNVTSVASFKMKIKNAEHSDVKKIKSNILLVNVDN